MGTVTGAPPAPTAWIARTRELPADVSDRLDLVSWVGPDGSLFRRPGLEIAGRGRALVIDIPGGLAQHGSERSSGRPDPVVAALGAIDTDDDVGVPGTGPVAVASLPFDPTLDGRLHVPSVLVGRRDDGVGWVTVVVPSGSPLPTGVEESLGGSVPAADRDRRGERGDPVPRVDSFVLKPSPPHAIWMSRIEEAVDAIHRGEIEKVVLAREVIVETNGTIAVVEVLERLCRLYPSCTTFHVGGFLGASPELLIRRMGRSVSSFPLAGTIPHSGDAVTDARAAAALLSSAKERHEHDVAARAVAGCLEPVCDSLSVPSVPSIVSLRNVSHLGTDVHGTLSSATRSLSALDLSALLHPTPAVAGTPTAAALSWIAKLEHLDRGPYAGPVGWMDARGDGEFFLGIRSAVVAGHRARLLAGVGIVADSTPENELAETQLKFQALLAALVRP